MGILADFREVIKGLKRKKIGESTIKICPKCGSPKISLSSGFDVYPRLYGITPMQYVCLECSFKGPIVLETTEETG